MKRTRTVSVVATAIGLAVVGAMAQSIGVHAAGASSQLPQEITFSSSPPTSAVVGSPSYTVTATGGGSGNPVVFSTAVPAVCSLSGSVVSFVGVGPCVIIATQAGNRRYFHATKVQQGVLVTTPVCPAQQEYINCFTSSSSLTVREGHTFYFTVTTIGNPVPHIKRNGLPARGVHLVNNRNGTATLSGTPGKKALGIHFVKWIAVFRWGDAYGGHIDTVTQNFTLTVVG